MRRLVVPASQEGYAVSYGNEVLSAQLAGGPSRTRRDFIGAVASVAVTWNVPLGVYQYMEAFYRTATGNASESFLLDLILDGGLVQEYEAKFVPGSWQLVSTQGFEVTLGAQLEVKPKPVDLDYDTSVLDVFESYEEDWFNAFLELTQLANYYFLFDEDSEPETGGQLDFSDPDNSGLIV